MSRPFSWQSFENMPIVGIMRDVPPAATHTLGSLYLAAGLTTLEITMNSEGAGATLAALTEQYSGQLNIGAGTVLTKEDLHTALNAGAQFIVTPVLDEAIIRECVEKEVPVFPGAYTPTEIYKAWSLGASMVKVFPASKLGPQYIKEVLAPMRFLKLLPTGGVNLENCQEFLEAGASGLALGSSLFPKNLIAQEAWDELKKIYEEYYQRVKEQLQK